VRHLRIRQKQNYEGMGKKRRAVGQEIGVYNGKKKVVDRNFKTVDQAVEACGVYQMHRNKKVFKLN